MKFFKDRKVYDKYSRYLKERNFPSADAWNLLQDFGAYFESFSDKIIDFDKFEEWFFQFRRPDLPMESRESLKEAFKLIKEPFDEEFTKEALKSFKKQSTVDKLRDILTTNCDIDLEELKKEISQFEKDDVDLVNNTKVNGSLEHVLNVASSSSGYTWHLPCLTQSLPALSKGIFVVVAARPGVGKSSFLSHLSAHLLKQIPGPILWLNNENIGERACYLRFYEALFNKRSDELLSEKDKVSASIEKHKILEKLICHDIQGLGKKEVESLVLHYKPSVLIIDMLDYLSGFDIKNNETSDTKYLKLYQWALDLSCQHCPVIGTSQLADRAEGWTREGYSPELSMWPLEADLMGSRTAKQGKASAIIMIGKHNMFPNKRYLSAPRNKYGVEGALKHTVTLDRERSRFLEN